MNHDRSLRTTPLLTAGAAALAIAGFTALGSIFQYPQILKAPTAEILTAYREHHTVISLWFMVLAVGAGLLAPVGVALSRLVSGPLGQWIAGIGIAAATVQVLGLSRWTLLIPAVSTDAADPTLAEQAHETFRALHFWLGTILGETIGYTLTATFTVLAVIGLARSAIGNRWTSRLGYVAAALIATGTAVPLGLSGASLTNFAGYIAWCLWLVVMALILWRTPLSGHVSDLEPPAELDRSPKYLSQT